MTTGETGGDARWVDGTLESGADPGPGSDTGADEVPNPETGVGIGAGRESSFEPEEEAGAERPPQ